MQKRNTQSSSLVWATTWNICHNTLNRRCLLPCRAVSALPVYGFLVKKLVRDFGRNRARKSRFYGFREQKLNRDGAIRQVLSCQRCLSAPRKGRFRLAFGHVSHHETCLKVRRNVKSGTQKATNKT